jgi:hypothetical protein
MGCLVLIAALFAHNVSLGQIPFKKLTKINHAGGSLKTR